MVYSIMHLREAPRLHNYRRAAKGSDSTHRVQGGSTRSLVWHVQQGDIEVTALQRHEQSKRVKVQEKRTGVEVIGGFEE